MSIPKDTKGAEPDDVEAHGRLRDTSDDVEARGRLRNTSDDVEGHTFQPRPPRPDEDDDDDVDVEGHRLR
jgi:hypothetical protein